MILLLCSIALAVISLVYALDLKDKRNRPDFLSTLFAVVWFALFSAGCLFVWFLAGDGP